jgi:hypothetical protein
MIGRVRLSLGILSLNLKRVPLKNGYIESTWMEPSVLSQNYLGFLKTMQKSIEHDKNI